MLPSGIAAPVALAVRAVPHGDQPGLDQRPVDRLHPRRRQAERLLLQRSRGPDDRPPSPPPVLRLGEAEQPVHHVHQARRQTEPRRGRLEGGQQLSGRRHAVRQAGEALRRAVGLQQARRQAPEAAWCRGKAPPLRPWGAIRSPSRSPSRWIATGKPPPSAEIGNFRLMMRRLPTTLGVFSVPRRSRKARHEFR